MRLKQRHFIMFYIFTSDYYLWLGISSLLYPCECQWLSEEAIQAGALENMTSRDILIFDTSTELYPVYKFIRHRHISPRFVFMKQQSDMPLELFISTCEVLDKNYSLNKVRSHILNPRSRVQFKGPQLSAREALSINLSITGLTVKQISEALGVEGKTIYAHRLNACRKLGVNKVCELIPFKNLVLLKTGDAKQRWS
ncbi:helix-turn-helix domain-containing protein [Enterobacter roggenkampii]|uniref:helix-turn-helix domain-containing protein n=1 Tax=Enterobacter roggenkampii TaxID=1812935 RepID=UPI002DBB8F38|nr:helix-turn-helix transcriptional regulator [Enterobacter roggenkampii]MEB6622479.1 helix-turn-helix transcriptional regulator [Enterobacter roggenkampii]